MDSNDLGVDGGCGQCPGIGFQKKVGAYELVTSYRLLSKCLPGFEAL